MPNDGIYISPSDRDYLIRTVIGEAADQPETGQAAVAHVVLNRLNRGYGRNATEVMMAPNQFEPWSTRRKELMAYGNDDPAYKKAAAVVDGVLSGSTADPTSGATHFLQEETVRQRRGGGLPDWAQGRGLKIGAHTFYTPGQQYASALDKYTKSDALPSLQLLSTPGQPQSALDKYTKTNDDDLAPDEVKIGDFTYKLPSGQTAQPMTTTRPPGWFKSIVQEGKARIGADMPKIGNALYNAPKNFIQSGIQQAEGGWENIKQGVRDLRGGNILPTFGSPDERRPGALLNMGYGAMQGLTGVTGIGPATEMVEDLGTNLTGNPDFGSKLGLVSNAAIPSSAIVRGANRLRPTVRAQEALGDVMLTPEQIARMESNPRLTPMDVNPTYRQIAMGVYNEPGAAKNKLYQTVRERAESAPGAVREAYDTMAGPAPNVIETVENFKNTARTNASKGFGEAFKDVTNVNAVPVIEAIDAKLKPGVNAVASPGTTLPYGPLERELLELRAKLTNDKSVLTDPQRLHEIQSEFGRDIRDYSQSSNAGERKLSRQLRPYLEKLVDQIDESAGGKYRPAREKYRSDMDVQDAFEKGTSLFVNRNNMKGMLEDTPDAWRRWRDGRTNSKGEIVGAASPEEIEAAKLGARASVEQTVMGFRHSARRGTDVADVPYNQEKMEILFGKDEARRLVQLMKDERDIALTNSKLIANSDTAERLAGREMAKVRDPSGSAMEFLSSPMMTAAAEIGTQYASGLQGVGGTLAGVSIAARHVANRLGRNNDMSRNLIMADILSRSGKGGIEGLVDSIKASEGKNRLFGPAAPVAYSPPDVRESRPVPFKQD